MSTRHDFRVPTPVALTDIEIASAAQILENYCRELTGVDSGVILGSDVNRLEPPARWLYLFLHAGHEILKAEDDRRTSAEAAAGLSKLEAFLEEQQR